MIEGEEVEDCRPLLVISRDSRSTKHGHLSYAWEDALILGPSIEEHFDD